MKTIRGRITVAACLVLVISIAIVAFTNIYYMTGRLQAKEKKHLQAEADYYAEEINTEFMKEINLLRGFEAAVSSLNKVDEDRIKVIIDRFYDQNPELLNIYFGGDDGLFIKANNGATLPDDYDPTTRTWYINAMETDSIVVTNPYLAASAKVMCATVSMPLQMGGTNVGCVGLDIALTTIIGLVDGISYEEGAYAFLVDSDYNIVTHPLEEYLPTEEVSTNIKDVFPELQEEGSVLDGEIKELKNYDDENYYFASSVVEGCQWTLVVAVPASLVLQDCMKVTGISIAIAVIAVLFSIIVCLILLKREFSPIEKMIPEIEKISKGDFSADLNITARSKEFATLQESIQHMVDIINEIITQENTVLGEISDGNLAVEDMSEFEGEFNEISTSVNSIKATLNALISEIQFSAINLQSTAMGFTGSADPEEMKAIFEELSAEACDLMDKANKFKTKYN